MLNERAVCEALTAVAVKNDQFVWARSPVRLDLAGGWTATPPYTLRYGGKMVNVAVDLNGQPPVQLYVRKTAELRIRAQSIDLGRREDFCSFEDLEGYGSPGASFALVKASLAILGFSRGSGSGSLEELLRSIGGGMEITVFVAVPKGSELGTSSILAGTILGALHRFLGQSPGIRQLCDEVLRLEQKMTTGGGWQDQVGGLVGGVKFIESRPAEELNSNVEYLDDFLFSRSEATDCLTLYYTGITRLAKNILEGVVERLEAAEAGYLELHGHLRGWRTRRGRRFRAGRWGCWRIRWRNRGRRISAFIRV